MDVRNRQEDITAFSTIETINVIPVGILYLDSWAVKAAQSAKSQVINAAEIGGVGPKGRDGIRIPRETPP